MTTKQSEQSAADKAFEAWGKSRYQFASADTIQAMRETWNARGAADVAAVDDTACDDPRDAQQSIWNLACAGVKRRIAALDAAVKDER